MHFEEGAHGLFGGSVPQFVFVQDYANYAEDILDKILCLRFGIACREYIGLTMGISTVRTRTGALRLTFTRPIAPPRVIGSRIYLTPFKSLSRAGKRAFHSSFPRKLGDGCEQVSDTDNPLRLS